MTTYDINKKYIKPKRRVSTTQDELYMLHALIASSNSKDPSTQVGACYVSESGDLLSVGCNHAPRNWSEDDFPWGSDPEYGAKNTKYPYVIHAEMAAIANYNGSAMDFKNATLYVTLFPCPNCAKLISSFGIKKIVYLNARKNCEDFEQAMILLKRSNIECVDFREIENNVLQNFNLNLTEDEKNNIEIKRLQKII